MGQYHLTPGQRMDPRLVFRLYTAGVITREQELDYLTQYLTDGKYKTALDWAHSADPTLPEVIKGYAHEFRTRNP